APLSSAGALSHSTSNAAPASPAAHPASLHPAAPAVLRVQDLMVRDSRGHTALDGVSFAIAPGEILGIAGVEGNGQTELVEALTGLRTAQSGQIYLDDKPMLNARPRPLIHAGLGHVPEDRQKYGL